MRKNRSANFGYKDISRAINEGLMNPYCYNFGQNTNNMFHPDRTNCIHDVI